MEAATIMTDIPVRRQGRSSFAAGARATAPLAIAVVAFGASYGIMARDAGMGVVAPIVMSLTTFAGSAQFAVASVLESGGAVAAAIVAAVLLNLRYLAIGVSVAPALRGSAPRRVAEAQLAVDESWAVASRNGRVDRGRLLGAGTVLMASWIGGTVAGTLGGSALGDPADYGLDAMFPALVPGAAGGPARRPPRAGGRAFGCAHRGRPDPGGAARTADRRRRARRGARPEGARMSAAWLAVLVVGVATIALKGAGTLVLAGRPLPRPAAAVMPLLAPCLLAALVVGQTMADGRALVVDARVAGVAAAAVALALRAPLLVVLGAAAGVAAAARALGAA